MIDKKEFLIAKRGYVYEFRVNADLDKKVYALVVSSNSRSSDNVISLILLSSTYNGESVPIRNSIFQEETMYANCGKVTFSERNRLVKECFKISESKMSKINFTLSCVLGINSEFMAAENKIYKELYENLLERTLGKNDEK